MMSPVSPMASKVSHTTPFQRFWSIIGTSLRHHIKYSNLYYSSSQTCFHCLRSVLDFCSRSNTHRDRSSHRRCCIKKDVLRNFLKFSGKHLCQSLFFNKVAGLWPATLLKNRLWHKCFHVNFRKFLRNLFYRTPPDDCFYTGTISILFFWKTTFLSSINI